MVSRITLCGMDVHEKKIVTQTALDQGEPELRTFANTDKGRKSLVAYLNGKGADRVLCAYEASSLGFGLHDELCQEGFECSVLAPTKLKASRKDRKNKTDAKDALRILQAIRNHVFAGDDLPAVWIPDLETRDDRELVRARIEVSQKISSIKTQILSLLKRNGVKKAEGVGKAWTLPHKRWLDRLCSEPTDVLGFGGLAALGSLLRNLKFLEEEKSRLDKDLAFLSGTERYRSTSWALVRMPGVGPLTSMVFLTELGDLKRFRNRRKIANYLGLAPSSFESGDANDRKGHITREGPSRVRHVLNQATWSRIRSCKKVRNSWDALVHRNPKKKKIAVVALMRRLAIEMWHVAKGAA